MPGVRLLLIREKGASVRTAGRAEAEGPGRGPGADGAYGAVLYASFSEDVKVS